MGLVLGLAAACGGSAHSPAAQAPPASARPAPTVDPISQARQQVTAAQRGYYQSYLAAVAAPGNQDRVNNLLTNYTSTAPARADVAGLLSTLVAHHVAGRAGPHSYYVIETLNVGPQPVRQVVATVCGYDDGVLFDAKQKAPDGKEIVVNDTPVSERTLFTWVRTNGSTWQIDVTKTVNTWNGVNRCPPRSGSS